MTIDEAKEILEEVKTLDDSVYQYNKEYMDALNVAIKLLDQHSNIINASDIKQDDEWMQENEWDEVYKDEDIIPSVSFEEVEKSFIEDVEAVKDLLPSKTHENARKHTETHECDCIDRQAVLDCAYPYGYGLEPEGYRIDVEDVQNLPPVSPARKTGKWKEVYAESDGSNSWIEFQCPHCGDTFGIESGEYGWHYTDPIPWKACPMCGGLADMRGGNDEND